MPLLEVHFLGECQFLYDEERVAGLQTKRLRSLLGYLLLHSGQQLSTTQLAFLFWPDSSEKQAKTNLRRQFFNLRKAFPEIESYLVRKDHSVLWRTDIPYSLDVTQFSSQLSQAKALDQQGKYDAAKTALAEVISLYRGELLPDCYDDWILPIREQLRQDFLNAIHQLIGLLENEADYAAAIQYAEILIKQDPLLEQAYRKLMQLYSLSGDRASALRTYHLCISTLERELGVEPHRDTVSVYKSLLEIDESPTDNHRAVPPSSSQARQQSEVAQLVGRQRERKQLLTIWRQAAEGSAKFVLISGEAGIGKTRLAEELFHWVQQLGIDVAKTRSFLAAGELPYAPVTEWLRSKSLTERRKSLEPIWITELLRLVPDIKPDHTNLPSPQPLAEDWQRQRLYEAMVRAFTNSQQPLLLWVDDVQWCDRESLSWFQYLMQSASAAPLLILACVRSEELELEHPLITLLEQLRHSNQLLEIELERLSQTETAQLVQYVGNAKLAHDTIESVCQDSQGNPLFAAEMVRNIVDLDYSIEADEAGTQEIVQGYTGRSEILQQAPFGNNRPTVPLPPKVYNVIRSRLSRLSKPAYQLVGLAATIGRSFPYQVLAAASEMSDSELMLSLDELWQRRILREQSTDTIGPTYDFSHDRIRDVAYHELSVIRRSHYHRSIAQTLESVFADKVEEWSAQIAHHYQRTNNNAKSCKFYQIAGERAVNQFAHADGLSYHLQALYLVGEQDHEKRFELHAHIERIYHVQTSRELQQQELKKMLLLAEQLDDQSKLTMVWLRQAECAEAQGHYGRAIDAATAAIQNAHKLDSLRLATQGVMKLGLVYWNQGDYQNSEKQFRQALRSAEEIHESSMVADAILHIGALQTYIGHYKEAREVSLQALESALALEDTEGEIWARNQLGFQIVEQGDHDYSEAKEHFHKGLELATRIEHRAYITKLSSNLAMTYDRLGEHASARTHLDESLSIASEGGSMRQKAFVLNYQANVFLHQCQIDQAKEKFEEAEQLFGQIGYRQGTGKTQSELSLLHSWIGEYPIGLELSNHALKIAQEIGIQRDQAYAYTRQGYAYEGLLNWSLATHAYEQALALYRQTEQQNRSLEPVAGLVRMATATGDLDQALNLSELILARIQHHLLDVTSESLWVYFTCWHILNLADDPLSTEVLSLTNPLLRTCTAHVPNFLMKFANGTDLNPFWNAFGTPPALS